MLQSRDNKRRKIQIKKEKDNGIKNIIRYRTVFILFHKFTVLHGNRCVFCYDFRWTNSWTDCGCYWDRRYDPFFWLHVVPDPLALGPCMRESLFVLRLTKINFCGIINQIQHKARAYGRYTKM